MRGGTSVTFDDGILRVYPFAAVVPDKTVRDEWLPQK